MFVSVGTQIKWSLLTASAVAFVFLLATPVAAADFNPSSLTSDGEFTDVNSMDAAAIQRFLEDKGSFLQSYSENGRTAAQIIWDAAHGKNDAAGTAGGIAITESTGTVSPKVLLVTLQKEQSLISMTSQNDASLRTAMGYACPDSGGCNSAYAGFTKQVENAAWQLRYNYERAQGRGFDDYQVGQSFCTSDHNGTNCGTYDNRATAALYRYTPHVYNGNYNFWNMFYNTYGFSGAEYNATIVSWASSAGGGVYPAVRTGSAVTITAVLRNTGRTTWRQGAVNLGTERPRDKHFSLGRGDSGWTSGNRVQMTEASVASGATGTFTFSVSPPHETAPGVYREYFRPVADGVAWFGPELYWDVEVVPAYVSRVDSWSTSSGGGVYPTISRGGTGTNIVLRVRNDGSATWTRGVVNLATDRPKDRGTGFLRESLTGAASGWVSENRIQMTESSVAPGETATYSFWLAAPAGMSPGTYREHYRLVADGIGWFPDYGYYWDVTVQ